MVQRLTLNQLCAIQHKENPYRVAGLRPDSLSLLMHHAYIKPNIDCLLFDNTRGIVLAGLQ